MNKNNPKQKRPYGGIQASCRIEERRGKLLAAGLEAFGTTGYNKSTIKSICAFAGLTERYFYESFKNKEALLGQVYNGVVDGLVGEVMDCLSQPTPQGLDPVFEALRIYYESLHDDPRKARVLYFEVLGVSPAIDKEYRTATRRLSDIISLVVSTAIPAIDQKLLEASIVPTGLAGALNLIAERWVLDDFCTPLEDILSQISSLVQMAGQLLEHSDWLHP